MGFGIDVLGCGNVFGGLQFNDMSDIMIEKCCEGEMTMETTRRTGPQRQLRLKLRQRVEWGRWGFLAIIFISFINQILLLCGAKFHFLFSAAMPYYLNWLASQLGLVGFQVIATLLTFMLYGAYGACWLLSGRKREWMVATLALYGVDTLMLIVFALALLENPASCLLEVLVHIAGLVLLFFAFQAFEQLRKMPRRRRPAPVRVPEE